MIATTSGWIDLEGIMLSGRNLKRHLKWLHSVILEMENR